MADADMIVHATCVALHGDGVLIMGPSGTGKSALALQLLATGAHLVADDRTILRREGSTLCASAPASIAGLIEARGVGLLSVDPLAKAPLVLVVDMSVHETARLPERHTKTLLDIDLPCLHKVDAPYFAAAIHAYMTGNLHEAR